MAETWIEIKDKREVIDDIVDDELDGFEKKMVTKVKKRRMKQYALK